MDNTSNKRKKKNSGPAFHTSSRRGASRKKRKTGGKQIAAAVVCIAVIAGCLSYLIWQNNGGKQWSRPAGGKETEKQEEIVVRQVTVEGLDLTGMTKEEVRGTVEKAFPWKMQITMGESVYEVPNLMEDRIDRLIDEIFSDTEQSQYIIDTSGLEDQVEAEARQVALLWNRPAKNGELSGYDKEKAVFLFGGEENGIELDKDSLASEMTKALDAKDFDSVIQAAYREIEPDQGEGTEESLYKILAAFSTDTTANSARNTNIRLSAESLNGTILQPGEEFSFNETVGQRTAAKGYKGATAYSNGEVVQEIGGGVCQLSTTLYNATVKSGLEITKRQSHTFEPSYITPGGDATVSWGNPDFKFRNNSTSPIGILASFADRKLTVSIYGKPILEDGMEYELKSKKVKDLGVPAPTYVEDPTLAPGTEVVKSNGSRGSVWETTLVIKQNGQVVSEELQHRTTYKGHNPVVARNSATPVEESTVPPPSETPEEESTAPMEWGPGYAQTTSPADGPENEGPGAETSAQQGPGPGGQESSDVQSGPGTNGPG